MKLRKLKADKIFDGQRFVTDKVLLISESGVVVGLTADDGGAQKTETYKGILAPGLVNCHCHLELSHLKGKIEEHTGLVKFLSEVMGLRGFSKEEIQQAIVVAQSRMYQHGIEAVGDICNTLDTLMPKREGRLHYHNFVELLGFVPAQAATRFEAAFTNVYTPLLAQNSHTSMVPHAPYSISDDLFQLINQQEKNKIVSIHNQETEEENIFFEKGEGAFVAFYKQINTDISFYTPSGNSSLQTYLPKLSLPSKVLLVHNTAASEKDVCFAEQLAKENKQTLYWVLCPNANLYIEERLPNLDLLRKYHCHIVLGTDSLASNHQLDILSEVSTLRQHFPCLSLEELLQWATLGGAEALGFDNVLGSFEEGKTPGVILINEDTLTAERIV